MTLPAEQTQCCVCGSTSSSPEAEGVDYVFESCEDQIQAVRCDDCSHIYLNPRPTVDAIDIIYPSDQGTFLKGQKRWGGFVSNSKDWVIYQRFQSLAKDLPKQPKILDIGCGDGSFLLSLRRKRKDLELWGLDWKFSEEVAQELRENNINMITARLEDADLSEGEFDLITMNQLIEHLWSPREALENLQKGLRPGGLLSIETPNVDGYDRRWFKDGLWGGYYFPRHLNLYGWENLERFCTDCGFEVHSHDNLMASVIWVYSLFAWSKSRKPGPSLFRKFFSAKNPVALAMFTAIDMAAVKTGQMSSNQKLTVRKAA